MIKQAIKDTPYFAFSDFELRHEGTTYTAQTLKRLQKTYPDHRFYFLMGGDSLFELETLVSPGNDHENDNDPGIFPKRRNYAADV